MSDNAFNYEKADMDKMESINDNLRKMVPMITDGGISGRSGYDYSPDGKQRSESGYGSASANVSRFGMEDDRRSMMSHANTVASRRSDFTMLTLKSAAT